MATVYDWALNITPLDISSKTASIVAVRRTWDDSDPTTILTNDTYTVAKATLDTVTQSNNVWILDEISNQHQAALTKQANIDNFVSGLEALGKTNLEARE